VLGSRSELASQQGVTRRSNANMRLECCKHCRCAVGLTGHSTPRTNNHCTDTGESTDRAFSTTRPGRYCLSSSQSPFYPPLGAHPDPETPFKVHSAPNQPTSGHLPSPPTGQTPPHLPVAHHPGPRKFHQIPNNRNLFRTELALPSSRWAFCGRYRFRGLPMGES